MLPPNCINSAYSLLRIRSTKKMRPPYDGDARRPVPLPIK
jgi:hypothetical protein